jgi:DNA polymerase-3 subunit alpha
MPEYFAFDCGCKFHILDNKGEYPKIDFSPKPENVNFECSRTWDLISDGNTKGIFQLESRLGHMMAKKLKPGNIEQLSALISILRPGTLEAIRDGKSVTNHYIDKKNGLESIDYFHSALESSLGSTLGEMIYQEQAMQIAKDIAGFDLKESDTLRKIIGKKQVAQMAAMKSKFLEGCKNKNIVSEQDAEQIFGWIEKSQRYSFNKSHAVSYAVNAYLSAYAKAHFPRIFFASYLKFAKDKIDPQQEIKELVRNAGEMNISVRLPDFRNLNSHFMIKNKEIYFGLTDIKGVGDSVFKKILEISKIVNLSSLSWLNMLTQVLLKINSTAAKALISCGALDYFKKNRTEMLFELEVISNFTKKELELFQNIITEKANINLEKAVTSLLQDKITKKRIETINNILQSIKDPPYSLTDKIEWLSDNENSLLGVAISCSKLDCYDIAMTNTNCKEFKTTLLDKIIIAGEISNINIIKTKKGKNPGQEMAFISIEDQYGLVDSIIFFPEQLEAYKHHLFENNILIFVGNKTKNKDGLVVEKCFSPRT